MTASEMAKPTTRSNPWAIVLAAGNGTRLSGLTLDHGGTAVPKQFCSLAGGPTLLRIALERAAGIVPQEHLFVVVAEEHRRWWESELCSLPRDNVIVQPANRGTAHGILLPLLSVLERDRAACVVVLPSDHYVRQERVLAAALRSALAELAEDGITLLGITPEGPETDYGWIVPVKDGSRANVAAFVEKPALAEARACMERGGVWNSFLFAARGSSLLDLVGRRLPTQRRAFEAAYAVGRDAREQALSDLYSRLESVDFSRGVLQGSEASLRLKVVPACGWTDLGTPTRVAQCLEALGSNGAQRPTPGGVEGPIDLRRSLEHLAHSKPTCTPVALRHAAEA